MIANQWMCGYFLTFSDAGPKESRCLHRGTLEECREVFDTVPAIAYSGDRPLKEGRLLIVQLDDEAQAKINAGIPPTPTTSAESSTPEAK